MWASTVRSCRIGETHITGYAKPEGEGNDMIAKMRTLAMHWIGLNVLPPP